MRNPPFRTGRTWLSDNQLTLLDVLFDGPAPFTVLRSDIFHEQWNLGYSHNLSDEKLGCELRWLCEHGVLEIQRVGHRAIYRITANGGELWSQERCPVWERYCMERYHTTSRGRTMMSVVATSPHIRDGFLRLWPLYPARHRCATIADYGLIRWRPLARLHAGLATYQEEHPSGGPQRNCGPITRRIVIIKTLLERERTWWRFVPELQKFTAA
jgi:hypothetical protein